MSKKDAGYITRYKGEVKYSNEPFDITLDDGTPFPVYFVNWRTSEAKEIAGIIGAKERDVEKAVNDFVPKKADTKPHKDK